MIDANGIDEDGVEHFNCVDCLCWCTADELDCEDRCEECADWIEFPDECVDCTARFGEGELDQDGRCAFCAEEALNDE